MKRFIIKLILGLFDSLLLGSVCLVILLRSYRQPVLMEKSNYG